MDFVINAVNELLQGNIVAFPTETVYGLAVDTGNLEALHKLYALKGRPLNKPSAIAIAEPQDIKQWVTAVSPEALKLIDAFWPGPLTVILQAASHVSEAINAGCRGVGVRCSPSPLLREAIRLLGRPICLTSANLSGQKEAITAKQVRSYFPTGVFILERDDIVTGQVSTIVDLSVTPYRIVREGLISPSDIQKILNEPQMTQLNGKNDITI